MAFITPTNNVKLLTGVPINNDYENTLYFQNRTAQYNYFSSKVKYVNSHPLAWSDISYQRYMRNSIKLEINAESVYDCNYMMFQNTNFGDRWFYAFIVNIEYIANQVTRIDYQIDAIQTWLLDCTINPSFVVRKHFAQDSIYTSRVEEGLETGDYVIDNIDLFNSNHQTLNQYYGNTIYVVAVTRVPWNTAYDSQNPNEVYDSFKRVRGAGNGLSYVCFPHTQQGIIGINTLIANYRHWSSLGVSQDDIVFIFEAPKHLFMDDSVEEVACNTVLGGIGTLFRNDGQMFNPLNINPNTDVDAMNFTFTFPTLNSTYGNDIKNKKLLQYPYSFIYVYDGKGNNATYNIEDFTWTGETPPTTGTFTMLSSGNSDTAMSMIPRNYKGLDKNRNESITYKGFPQCAWVNDLFKAWYAQNGGVVGSAVRMISGVGLETSQENTWSPITNMNQIPSSGNSWYAPQVEELGNVGGFKNVSVTKPGYMTSKTNVNVTGLSNVKDNVLNELKNVAQHSKMPAHVCGNFNTDLNYFDGMHTFNVVHMHIREDYARRIDQYFNMYGYYSKTVEEVNYWSRPHWNYIQTKGLNIIASIPESFVKEIISIFENGIRFWKNPTEVGSYLTIDNSPQ